MTTNNVLGYRANSKKVTQLIASGFVASLAMMGFAYVVRALGVSAPDFAAQYGAILNDQVHPAAYTGMWWVGMGWHLLNGTVIFSLLYDFLADRSMLTNQRRLKGLIYGAAIWLLVAAAVAPAAGEGLFFQNMPQAISYGAMALFSWLIYGVVLEEMTQTPLVRQLEVSERRAA